MFQPAAGGLLVGLVGWFVPQVLGVGYSFVGQALNGQMIVTTMALLVCLKVVATATCYASGNAGGIFGPSLYMGAMTGGAVGGVAHLLMPDYTGSVGAYALVGMGAAFAGIVRVPLTSVIMIFEMTRDYSIIVPLMIANLISYFISSKLQAEPIYEALQHQDGIHLPSGARARAALLMVGNAFQPAAQALSAGERISQAAASVDWQRGAWPVVDENGLRGMVTAEQLSEALQANRTEETLTALVSEPPPLDRLTAENFPHVHADHPLDLALRRIAQSSIKVLPVVSRASLRELRGTISLEDILAAYRIGTATAEAPGNGVPSGRRKFTPLAGALAGLVLLMVLAGFLNYFYRASRQARAQQDYRVGNELMQEGRYDEAIEQFRNALSIAHSLEDRRALGLALVKTSRLEDGALYLDEVVRERPDDGPAHLGLAEIAAQKGQIDAAVSQYRHAIDGAWPQNAQENRLDARIALVNALAKAGRQAQALAELLSLAAEIPSQPTWQKRVARMLADFGMPQQAAALYRDVLQHNGQDTDAWHGLGDAEFTLGDFAAAKQAFQGAINIDSTDAVAKTRIALFDELLALDPVLPGLKAADRYQRSRELLMRVMDRVRECNPTALPEAQVALSRRRPASFSFSDAAEANIALAGRLWADGLKGCTKPAADDALSVLMVRLNGASAH